eukprot:Pompholyxophrys_punicea_v1_NODE_101_length_3479_cov_7.724007.p2 type:complete len:180 gc:universal NODE_101_length_3479_cov_7.724007:2176-1637(-)
MTECCRTPCAHYFCRSCITKVLHNSQFCPYCRQKISIFSVILVATDQPLKLPTIYGSIYVQGDTLGLASYHFEKDSAYISYESEKCSMWPPLDNGEKPPARKFFQDVEYDEKNRIFRGIIDWSPTTWTGDQIWKYQMIFAEDFSTIECGSLSYFRPESEERHFDFFGITLCYKLYIPEL